MTTGQVRVVWQHLAFLGDESRWAAEAAECAGEQGRFWEYRDKLFEEARGRNSGAFTKANLTRYATEISLDGGAFARCLDSGRYAARVQAESDAARALGVTRTPTLEINGQRLVGIPSLDEVRALIRRAGSPEPASLSPPERPPARAFRRRGSVPP